MALKISADVERDIMRFAAAKAVSVDEFLREVLDLFLNQAFKGTNPPTVQASIKPHSASLPHRKDAEVAEKVGKRHILPAGLKVRIYDQSGKSYVGESLDGGRVRFDGVKEPFRTMEAARKQFRHGSENVWDVAEYYSDSRGEWRRIDVLRH